MAVQSRYEGPDLETVLEQVRGELGSGTKILSANKIRSGGIAGFFARERYEVIVEHDEVALLSAPVAAETDPDRSVRPRDLAPSLMDLVDQVSAEERAAAAEMPTAAPDSPAERPAAPRISTESEPFASILERVARHAGIADAPPAAAVHQTPDSDETAVEDVEVLHVGTDDLGEPAAPSPPTRHPFAVLADQRLAALSAGPVAPQAAAGVPAVTDVPAATGDAGALVKMGLPAAYVPAIPSPVALKGALVASLSRLPAAPPIPRSKGAVVVVVGERHAAMQTARDMAEEAGLDPDSITLATCRRVPPRSSQHLVIRDGQDAAEKRRSWRRRDRPSVVVVDHELAGDKPAWAYHVLAALEPEVTWGVVDATRKTEDIAAWMHRMGGIDALAVNGVDATVSPVAVLQLDVPIGRIDGRGASPALWAALLAERLTG